MGEQELIVGQGAAFLASPTSAFLSNKESTCICRESPESTLMNARLHPFFYYQRQENLRAMHFYTYRAVPMPD